MGFVADTLRSLPPGKLKELFLEELMGQGHPKSEQAYECGSGNYHFHFGAPSRFQAMSLSCRECVTRFLLTC